MSNLVKILTNRRILLSAGKSAKICRLSSTAVETSEPDHGLLLSESAVKRLKELGGGNSCLRITVEGGGCSGFQYKFDLVEDAVPAEDERIIDKDGAKVLIDETSLEYLKGSTVDYHRELIRAAFRIVNNPQADTGCSCGASFSVKLDL
ncbi:iron-sulfur cluster assembly 2 homolog, mitochondrial [Eurytemora carolleeae]|uniref:iron-sulfur cluster assembly 2 homolog, mitochondrial n=1 Tax=Eurytemora carolleeae TaxID=1294199 RepID=UPI000C76FF62|nr:iron-sulfur cluster assembly 2 homolog, mitochondrial [Eurytemora carolleeae]|eukprot:XP_023326993.1 iron-sulfur cluster assembly 2 homolog, mitochondrial-like [Eurytemora affinis]